ncbi:hypothetical protein M501DRAFT_937665 [Patellaria atrata CBS 101060]|uniref:Transmembrane protein n=1 Tax=Patellaria atrata CBS 101060 TaxID=1346257 RepID=A0A9P4S8X1_9PEZI|nr:hypothetical protein M501DRAFT_937665 [Patellaria atrata CBS 101060]
MKSNFILLALSLLSSAAIAAESTVGPAVIVSEENPSRTGLATLISPATAEPTDVATTSVNENGAPISGSNGGETIVEGGEGDDAAGAEGNDTGAFTISKGGLAAIITVVVVVVVFGIASVILYWLAKKRQWEVRKSIKRASRRLTGRLDNSKRKRQSTRIVSPTRTRRPADLEKGKPTTERVGNPAGGKTTTTTTISSTFDVETPTDKSWKSKLGLGGGKK